MKYIIFIIFSFISLMGCEPGSSIYVRNTTTTDLLIKTHPSIESLYPDFSHYRDSIMNYKIKDEGKLSLYLVKPLKDFLIWGKIGGKPTSNEIPFDYIELIAEKDTLILDSKIKIINELKLGGKRLNFYIQILK